LAAPRLADRRIIYLLALAAGLAVTVGGKPFAFLANTVLLVMALTWLWVRLSLGNLSVYLEPQQRVLTTADATVLRLRLNNEGFLPVPVVEVRAEEGCRPALSASWRGRVPALGTSSATLGPLHLPRGRYQLGPVQVEVSDPLGLWTVSTTVLGERVTVYPRVLPVEMPRLAAGRSFGRMRTCRHSQEDFSNLLEVRAFQPGDNPRLIDWKATARRGSWQVRVLEEGALPEVWIFVDGGDEPSVELAASLARLLLVTGALVGLVGPADPPVAVTPGRGQSKWRDIIEGLLRVEGMGLPLGELLGARLASLPRGATVIAVTCRLDAALFDALLRTCPRTPGTSLVLVGGADGEPVAAGDAQLSALREAGVGVLGARLARDPLRWCLEPVRPLLTAGSAGGERADLTRARRPSRSVG